MVPNPGTTGPPRSPGHLGPRVPQILRVLCTPRTSGPSGTSGPWHLPLPFQLQNINTQKLSNWSKEIRNQRGKLRVPFEVILFIELLTMIITGKSPPLLPSSNATVINRNDNQRHLIGYTWIEKNGIIKVCQNTYKSTLPYYRYTKENKHFHSIS